jgi:putative ABC transport system substrate-binding protein
MQTLRKIILVVLVLPFLFGNAASADSEGGGSAPRIGIVYTAPHPVINEIIDGLKEVVLAAFPKATFIERHASGNPAEYGNTVLAVLGQEPTILVPITTPIAKIAVEQARGRIPVVFAGVTDPRGAQIVDTLDHPNRATGSSDVCPFQALLKLTREVLPEAKKLGLPYNPTDEPAVFGFDQFTKLAPSFGFSIVSRQVTSRDELPTDVRGLASRVDAILIGPDNLMMENPDLVASAARLEGRAAFACDAASVEKGAVAGIGIEYRNVGKAAGELAVKVLNGAKPGALPVAVLNSGSVIVNKKAACLARVPLRIELLQRAKVVERGYQCPSS